MIMERQQPSLVQVKKVWPVEKYARYVLESTTSALSLTQQDSGKAGSWKVSARLALATSPVVMWVWLSYAHAVLQFQGQPH